MAHHRVAHGGFQINVKGKTDLKGAVIAGTQNAIDQNKNNFSTGTLTQSELQNHSNYEASSWGIGLSAGKADEGKAQTAQSDAVQVASFTGGLSGTSAGFSSKDGSSASTTHSGISGNTNGTGIAITDDLKQQSLTGKTAAETVAGISRDITTGTDSGSLIKDWDAQKLKDNVTAGAQITAAFGQAAAERIGTYADDKVKELENTDPAEAARWKEGGQYRVALHTATGALTGGLAGAAGAFTSATAMPIIGEAIEQMGLPKEVAQGLNQVAAGALGAVVGGAAGAASGVNVEANNRQLHPDEKTLARQLADQSKGKYTQAEIEEQMRGMSMTTRGITVAGNPDVIIGTKLGDGTWVKAGTTSDGQPIFTQQIAAEDTALRAYIVGNTTHGEIPGLITYGGTYVAPAYSNTPLPMPTAKCATAECAAGVLPNRPLTQPEIDAMRNGAADFAGSVSDQAGRFSSYATAYGTYLLLSPDLFTKGGAGVQFGLAGAATITELVANATEQLLRPNVGQMTVDSLTDLAGKPIMDRFPLLSPVTNEALEAWKKSSQAQTLRGKVNGK